MNPIRALCWAQPAFTFVMVKWVVVVMSYKNSKKDEELLLRKTNFVSAVEKTIWTGPAHAVRRHGRPLMPPHNMIPSPNVRK